MQPESAPPPTYSKDDPSDPGARRGSQVGAGDGGQLAPPQPQIVIVPPTDSMNFQNGFLGADGERAAIEGELQIKGAEPDKWCKITVSLRTVETAYDREIELSHSEIVLHSATPGPQGAALLSAYPFSVPLTPDTPQCIRTSLSSISHILTATLHPSDPSLRPIAESLEVQTRRYTSHTHTIAVSPETRTSDDPTRVKVEVPRTTFKVGEPIPVYVTVPPPRKELVLEQGLRLRNVRAELVRVVKVKREVGEDDFSDPEADVLSDNEGAHTDQPTTEDGPSNPFQHPHLASSSKAPLSPLFMGSSFRTIIARSGASCRFHSEKTVQLRFILHQPPPSDSPPDHPSELPMSEYQYAHRDSVGESASITQSTVLHNVSFRLNVYISFVNTANRTERFSTVTIPIIMIAPPAPLPEVEPSVDMAYQKKHDRPPVKTVRYDDDASVPHYEAGPSMHTSSAPPPFEERDAPPPFFFSEREASTSTRLPTFLESEQEIIIPDQQAMMAPAGEAHTVFGEGVQFGFRASEQFDGHSDVMQRSASPAIVIDNLAEIVGDHETENGIDALGRALAFDQHHHDVETGEEQLPPPPPPPAMDDPSDPPPSIDSEFRSPAISQQTAESNRLHPPPVEPTGQSSHGQAPPPYLIPDNDRDQGNVTRPPPYVDLVPPDL